MGRFERPDRGSSRGRSFGKPRDSPPRFEDRDQSRGRSSGRSYGRDSGSRSYGRDERRGRSSDMEMHKIICDECGKESEVPFKPTSSKPIYCSDCFKKHDNKGARSSSNGGGSSKVLDEINKKLDKILEAMDLE